MAYPLYEAIEQLGVPALFHTGQSGIGSGMPGSGGIRLKYSNPLVLDDVAVDFPDLKIIMAHPSFPWQDEALAVAARHIQRLHRPLRLVPEILPGEPGPVRELAPAHEGAVRLRLPDDPPDRWIADFEKLAIKPEVRPLIMRENALRLLGLDGAQRPPRGDPVEGNRP